MVVEWHRTYPEWNRTYSFWREHLIGIEKFWEQMRDEARERGDDRLADLYAEHVYKLVTLRRKLRFVGSP